LDSIPSLLQYQGELSEKVRYPVPVMGYPFVLKKSHKVVFHVNKYFCFTRFRISRIFSKTAISLSLKDLIFTCKLEMVLGSFFTAENPDRKFERKPIDC
jgi:hypothetical protein